MAIATGQTAPEFALYDTEKNLVSLGDQFVSGLRETLYAKSQPALTADLRIEVSTGYDDISLRGAAALALDALLSG